MKLIFLGGPASGKGTQTEFIAKDMKIAHISAGDLLREEIKAETEIGKKVKDLVENGQLVPNELIIVLIKERLKQDDAKNGFVLDGFPRDIDQAKAVEELNIDKVVEIKVSDNVLLERIAGRRVCSCGETYHLKFNPPKVEGVCNSCGKKLTQRKDDNEMTVKERIRLYHDKTEPLKDYYHKKLIEIDGEKSIEDIHQDILKKLRPRPFLLRIFCK